MRAEKAMIKTGTKIDALTAYTIKKKKLKIILQVCLFVCMCLCVCVRVWTQ
jgi:hypothetical protein